MVNKPANSLAPRLLQVAAATPQKSSGVPANAVKRISSRALLGQANSLIIDHEGVSYVLRATRLGKLILTK